MWCYMSRKTLHTCTNKFQDIESCRQPMERNISHALKGQVTSCNSSIVTKRGTSRSTGFRTFKISTWLASLLFSTRFGWRSLFVGIWKTNIFYLLDISSKSLFNTLKLYLKSNQSITKDGRGSSHLIFSCTPVHFYKQAILIWIFLKKYIEAATMDQ
jgi:hypothetical protein